MSKPNNVDPEEIKKFDSIAANWWDPEGPMKPLHILNPLRIDYIKKHHDITNQCILDVGCGGGILSEALAQQGGLVTGIDMSKDALSVAQQHAAKNNINLDYQHSSIEQFASNNPAPFDIITCLEMLEHVPDFPAIIKTCQQLLKPGGSLFISTINRTPKSFLFAIVGAEYVLRLLPRGTHEYAKFIQPSELNEAAKKSDLTLNDITGIHYNPLTQNFSFKQNVSVNYITHYKNDTKK
jgi:2-polyprenyl-6-hydroxyphenyl methylase / 3-demethylubiquinone-9 3-methyltransferase